MINPNNIHPQFITDAVGKRVSVVIPLAEYEALLEEFEDLAVLTERRDEPTMTHDELISGLRQDGLL